MGVALGILTNMKIEKNVAANWRKNKEMIYLTYQ